MINFRFHLVSLTAVFLALAIGITMGATVVERKTVDALNSRLNSVEAHVRATERLNNQLSSQHNLDADHLRAVGDLTVAGRLVGLDVMVLAVQGIDRAAVDTVRDALTKAGAGVEGTVWFTGRLRLDHPADVTALGTLLGAEGAPADQLRTGLVGRVVAALAAAEATALPTGTTTTTTPSGPTAPVAGPALLSEMRRLGWITFDAPNGRGELTGLPLPGSRFVVVSDGSADVPNDQWAVPFTTALATTLTQHVVAAEMGHPSVGRAPAVRAAFVGPLRSDGTVSSRLSTVDDLDDPVGGRVATVYALLAEAAPLPKTGHFGVGPGADRYLPSPIP